MPRPSETTNIVTLEDTDTVMIDRPSSAIAYFATLAAFKAYFDALYSTRYITDTDNGKTYKLISVNGEIGLEEV